MLLFFLSTLTFVTILGNLIVIFFILITRKLRRNITNCFIASLASADLLLGAVVMPFAIVDQMKYMEMERLAEAVKSYFVMWPYGRAWCDIWHAFDVLSSTASILNICLISIERYIALSNPFKYQSRMTQLRSMLLICLVWFCSILISFPAIFWWRSSDHMHTWNDSIETSPVSRNQCRFPDDVWYLIISSLISFYIPLLVMVVIYFRIYRKAKSVANALSSGARVVCRKPGAEYIVLRIHRGGIGEGSSQNAITKVSSLRVKPTSISSINEQPSTTDVVQNRCDTGSLSNERHKKTNSLILPTIRSSLQLSILPETSRTVSEQPSYNHSESVSEMDPAPSKSSKRTPSIKLARRWQRFCRDQRAVKTLGIIMGTFIVCWLPFFAYNTTKTIQQQKDSRVGEITFRVVTWLGYVNSSINPFIYALSLRDIRKVLSGLLYGLCRCLLAATNWKGKNSSSLNRNCQV